MNPPEEKAYLDWASKMNFSLAPVSYQDYLLGELLASQLHDCTVTNVSSYIFHAVDGEYLKEFIFKDGAAQQWNELIRRASGDYLDPKHFVKQFCGD